MVSLTHQPFWNFMCGRRKLPRSFFFVSRVSKITPSPIPINKGGLQGDLRMIYVLFTKWESPDIRLNGSEKTLLTYTHKNGVLRTLLRAMFTVCLQKAILKIVLSPNSHRNGKKLRLSHLTATEKWKPHPLLKNIPHLYEKNRGFGTPFWRLSATYLQFVYKNRHCKRK